MFKKKVDELSSKLNIKEAQSYYDEIRTKLALSKEKQNEMQCFSQFYESLNPYAKLKTDMTSVNQELYEWISRMFKGMEKKCIDYAEIEINEKQDCERVFRQIILESKDTEINPVAILLDFEEILNSANNTY